MGASLSCLGGRDRVYISRKPCISLRRKKQKLRKEQWWSGSFAVLQTSATVIMVVVLAAGGPVTLVVSVILTTAGALYQLWDYCDKGREIGAINEELKKRDAAEVRLVSVGTMPVPTPKSLETGYDSGYLHLPPKRHYDPPHTHSPFELRAEEEPLWPHTRQ